MNTVLNKLYKGLKKKKLKKGWYFSYSRKKIFSHFETYYYVAAGSNPPLIFLDSDLAPGINVYFYKRRSHVNFAYFKEGIKNIFDILERVEDLTKFPEEDILKLMGLGYGGEDFVGVYPIGQELAKKANHTDSLVLKKIT